MCISKILRLRPFRSSPHARRPRGTTLLELMVMLTVLGIMAAITLTRLGSSITTSFGAQAEGRRLSLDLLQAQRRAISTGDNHLVKFTTGAGGVITGYELYRRSGGLLAAEQPRAFTPGLTVTATANEIEFTFEGTALGAATVSLAGDSRTWHVGVVPSTGAVKMYE